MNQLSQDGTDRATPRRLFITGTDTDVGKTFIGCLLAEHFRHSGMQVGVYKPVASDCRDEGEERVAEDAKRLWNAAGKPRTLDEVCPQKFIAPVAPPQAARAEGRTVDRELLVNGAANWNLNFDISIIEGAGGLFSPLADGFLNADLVKRLDPIDVVVVAANRLGTIHQTLATCRAARSLGITPKGIILSDVTETLDRSAEQNAREIENYCDTPVVGRVRFGANAADVQSWAHRLLAVPFG
ncbi:dethiobiotin synthase [Novipirellula artificiosorum]|uniref:ATP-dependent dethiobiotin synthetase BioD n=1 Tax=Novipirellula artificiosorum TaxID=2528016 RepID=A0A5C6E0P5_9BACT|nr:dethiobiotin synthase [Novipirellula artificiosorum]TWU40739.1 ATP-dependent dethiobiotin synthetase BioD 1 [Novipirellula artificiosorum]